MKRILILSALCASISSAYADPSALEKAVNFVLTNNESGNVKPWIIEDLENCVFKRSEFLENWSYARFNQIIPEKITWYSKDKTMEDPKVPRKFYPVSFILLNLKGGKGILEYSYQFVDGSNVTLTLGEATKVDLEAHKRTWAWIFGPGGCKPFKSDQPF